LTLLQADARSTAILVNELDAGSFEGIFDDLKSCRTRLGRARLKLMHGYNSDASLIREVLLLPT
jgi:hypothetical protein